MANLRRFL